MLFALKQAGNKLVPVLGFEGLDNPWESTFRGSLVYRLWLALKKKVSKLAGAGGSQAGSWFEKLAFVVLLALVVALGLPQFASDKEGLAFFVLAALGLRTVGCLLDNTKTYKTNAIDLLVVAYLSIYMVATFSSHYLMASVKGLAKDLVYIVTYFIFAKTLSQSRKRVVLILAASVAAGLAVALYGLYQYKIGVAPLATWEDPNVETRATRIYSTLGNPNLLAGYLIPLTPISFALSMAALWAKRYWLFVPALGSTFVLAVAVVLTGSRGGYIGLAAAFLALMFVAARWLWEIGPKSRIFVSVAFMLMPLVVLLALQFVPSLEQRVMSIFAGREHTSNSFRLNVWQSSWQMFLDSWWIGVGPGNQTFRLAYGLYMRSGFDALGTYCVPLEILVEAGVFALATFASIIVALFARAHKTFWQSKDGVERWLILGLTSAIAGIMAHGLVDTVFYRPQVQIIFWLVVASLVALGSQSEKMIVNQNRTPAES